MEATSEEIEQLERTGNELSAAGHYGQSIEIWTRLIGLAPAHWRFALGLALDLRKKGDRQDADEIYRRAAQRFPNAFWILYHWALAAIQDQDLDRAEQRALRLLDLSAGTMKEPLGLLGDVAFARREFGEAERQFQRALQIDANDSYLKTRLNTAKRFARAAGAIDAPRPILPSAEAAADYGVLAINLDSRADRFQSLRQRFQDSPVAIERAPGVYGSYLPDIALQQLCRGTASHRRGTAGCFLAHVAAWEMCLRRGFERCLILEDDARPLLNLPSRFHTLGVPADFDLCFVNYRMQPLHETEAASEKDGFSYHDPVAALASWPPDHNAPGGDGYFISARGARKLLQFVERDGFGGDVDWRLVGYSATKGAFARVPRGSTAAAVLQHFENTPEPRLRAYAMYPALIHCEGKDSDRLKQNVG